MFTCTKKYSDLPAAHRQHNHAGHCSLIHGHNWGVTFTFGAEHLDRNQFVIDFGELKWLKEYINQLFDHTLLLNSDDPFLGYLINTLVDQPINMESINRCFANIRTVPNCGAEGLAFYIFNEINAQLAVNTGGRVFLVSVQVHEDERNSATWNPSQGVCSCTNGN